MSAYTTQNSLLLNNLMKFYKQDNNIDKMLQIMAASCDDLRTGSERSPYSSRCIAISSSNFFSASRYFL